MKVILLEEVTGKGLEGDVIDVARGFAVNYLFRRGKAIEATSGNLKQLESRRSNIEKREATRRADAEAIAAQLEGKTITIEAKAGEEGRLFGSVTSMMIQDEILSQLDVEVDRKKMDVGAHIKDVGEHEVAVRVSHDVHATVTVVVTPEGGELEERVSFMDDAEKAATQLLAAQGEGDDENAAEVLEGDTETEDSTELPAEEAAMHEETEEEAAAILEDVPADLESDEDTEDEA